jgi:GNAT superfamily N-acetyltransferase
MKMEYRFASEQDLDLLAEWNHQLIQDEGHRNPMAIPELKQRMRNWIAAEYKAVVFLVDNVPVAYGLYRENEEEIYLRQLFVRRDRRRSGIGRQAMVLFRQHIWPRQKRLTVDVLCKNSTAIQFWRMVGYNDYSLMLEIMPYEG